MAYAPYNPSDYATDFSWMGEIGNEFKQLAHQVPEFLTLNREIKENNKFKEKTWTASNRFIDGLDAEHIKNVAVSMGMQFENEQDARKKLKEMLPKFSEKTTNEEYAKQVTDSFYQPFMAAAFSDKNTAPLSFGDIIAKTNYGTLQDAIKASSIGKEQEEQAKYETEKERKYGTGGELETQGKIQNQTAMDLNAQKTQVETEQGKKSAGMISNAINNANSPEEAYKIVTDAGGTDQDAEAARKAYSDKLDFQLKQKQLEQYAKKPVNPKELETIDPNTFEKMIVDVSNTIGKINDDIASLKENKKKSKMSNVEYQTQLAQLNNQLKIATINQKTIDNAYTYFLKSGGRTKEDVLSASRVGASVVATKESMDTRVPAPGENTKLKGYDPTPLSKIVIDNANEELKTTGKISPETMAVITRHAQLKGITPQQFLIANGISSGSGTTQSSSTSSSLSTSTVKDSYEQDAIKQKYIEAAKKTITSPKATDQQKKNATDYLISVGESVDGI